MPKKKKTAEIGTYEYWINSENFRARISRPPPPPPPQTWTCSGATAPIASQAVAIALLIRTEECMNMHVCGVYEIPYQINIPNMLTIISAQILTS